MTMIDFAIVVLLTALFSAFEILLLMKWGVIEWLQVHGIGAKWDKINDLVSKMAHCNFCLSFWASVVLVPIGLVVTGNCYLLFIPLFSAPLTRFIL